MAAPTMACFIVTLLLDTLVAHELATSLAPEKKRYRSAQFGFLAKMTYRSDMRPECRK